MLLDVVPGNKPSYSGIHFPEKKITREFPEVCWVTRFVAKDWIGQLARPILIIQFSGDYARISGHWKGCALVLADITSWKACTITVDTRSRTNYTLKTQFRWRKLAHRLPVKYVNWKASVAYAEKNRRRITNREDYVKWNTIQLHVLFTLCNGNYTKRINSSYRWE